MLLRSTTKCRSIVIAVTAGLVVALSIITILVILDNATTATLDNFVAIDQLRTMDFAAFSSLTHLRQSIPFLTLGKEQTMTGFGECSTMDLNTLRLFFEDQIRILRVGIVQYLYVSREFNTSQWWDCNCAFTTVDFVCERPMYDATSNMYVLEIYTYPSDVVFPLTMVVNDTLTESFNEEYYVKAIQERTPRDIDGSWLHPYAGIDAAINMTYSVMTLTIPLEFNRDFTRTTKAISIDVSIMSLNKVLNAAKAYDSSILFLLSVETDVIVATSDVTASILDENMNLFTSTNYPLTIIRDAVRVMKSRQKTVAEHSWDHFTVSAYEVGTLHYFDRNLHHVIFEVTPRSVYYADIDKSRVTSIAIGSSVGAIALIGILVLIYSNTRMHRTELSERTRDISKAPQCDGENGEPICVMFTDITGSSRLWGAKPSAMHRAVEQHHVVIRTIIQEHDAYEVKTIGDSFMIVTKDAVSAVMIANELHEQMMKVEWDEELLQEPDAAVVVAEDEGVVNRTTPATLFCGLRIRIGIHRGKPMVFWDEVSKGYDYYGDCVNVAARLEASARSGETIISQSVVDALSQDYMDTQCVVQNMGMRMLKGIKDSVTCYSVSPTGPLSRRHNVELMMDSTPASPVLPM